MSLFFSIYGYVGVMFLDQLPTVVVPTVTLTFTFFQVPLVFVSTLLIAAGAVYVRFNRYDDLSLGKEIGRVGKSFRVVWAVAETKS